MNQRFIPYISAMYFLVNVWLEQPYVIANLT